MIEKKFPFEEARDAFQRADEHITDLQKQISVRRAGKKIIKHAMREAGKQEREAEREAERQEREAEKKVKLRKGTSLVTLKK